MSFVRCVCKHEAQDNWYGNGYRVANERPKPTTGPQEYRCTVCGRSHTQVVSPAKRPVFEKEEV